MSHPPDLEKALDYLLSALSENELSFLDQKLQEARKEERTLGIQGIRLRVFASGANFRLAADHLNAVATWKVFMQETGR